MNIAGNQNARGRHRRGHHCFCDDGNVHLICPTRQIRDALLVDQSLGRHLA
jgi:hypothetical protein